MPLRDPLPKKTLIWIGSSKRDLIAMPIPLRKEFGVALDIAQQALTPKGAKLLKRKAAGATQLSEDHHGDTYRAVYTVAFEGRPRAARDTAKEKLMPGITQEFEESSGNIFTDLGLPDADDLAYKAGLIGSIMRYQQEHGLSQSAVALLVDIPQPRLSNLFAGKMGGITSEKLIKACTRLGRHVRIVIEEHPGEAVAGRVELEVA